MKTGFICASGLNIVATVERNGRSLLAVGVTGASGAFTVGDAVDVVGASGEPVGKGIAAMSRADVDAVRGLSSAAIAARGLMLPAEVIHRDRFVLVEG